MTLDQAITLAVDTLGMRGPTSVALVMKEVRVRYPFRKYTPDELIEAERVTLRHKITRNFKEPLTGDHVAKLVGKRIPPQYQKLLGKVPTKMICLDKTGDGNWVLFYNATLEQLKANYKLRREIGRAVLRKADEVQDIIEEMEAVGARTPMDLLI